MATAHITYFPRLHGSALECREILATLLALGPGNVEFIAKSSGGVNLIRVWSSNPNGGNFFDSESSRVHN